jgi:formiminoglutamase
VPRLFDGELPQFNLGTNSGASCDDALTAAVEAACDASGRSRVTNGRFKGGWTTRHYGNPKDGVHAIQMELAQSTHLASETPPFAYDEDKAAGLRTTLAAILTRLAALAPELKP